MRWLIRGTTRSFRGFRPRLVPVGVAAVALAAGLLVPPPRPATAGTPSIRTQTFGTIPTGAGGSHTFVVPPRIKVVAFHAMGAAGGQSNGPAGGFGGGLSGLLQTTPGQALTVVVGTRGAVGVGGSNGGGAGGDSSYYAADYPDGAGGGGATTIAAAAGRIAVAGGGGGGGGSGSGHGGGAGGGGDGGSLAGEAGTAGCNMTTQGVGSHGGGEGGGSAVDPNAAGGARGTSTGYGEPGSPGSGGQGGAGGPAAWGGGGGGGGGGGWFGGGGGAGGTKAPWGYECGGGGGGGGSSGYRSPATAVNAERGVSAYDGWAEFAWLDDGGPVPVSVTVTPAQAKSPGQTVTLTATVKDQDGSAMAGRTVTWDRRGTNPGTSTAFTDASGNASLTYVGTGGAGADVVTASTPSLAGVTVSGVGAVVWAGTPSTSATVVAFAPPGAHAPSGTATLPFRATKADGSPFSGTVRYAVGPLGNPGAFSGTASASAGQGNITVTTAAGEVEVAAFADRSSPGTFGSPEPEEATGIAVVTTRPAPKGTVVAFAPPVGTGPTGSSVQLPFTAAYTDGAVFSGTVRWCAAPITSTSLPPTSCTSSGTATAGAGGNGTVSVTPTAANPTLRVAAYADAFTLGTPDATEANGVAVAAGTSVPPVTTTTTSLPPVTTTSVPVTTTTTTLPSVTTTSTTLPPVTTTSVPTTTTTLPPNAAPSAPSQVSPPADHAFATTTDVQAFVVNAVDPDGDTYTGTVQVTNGSGTTTSFPTAPALSGSDSVGAPPTPLGQGSYTWRARATDADGANSPWSASRSFTAANQAPVVPTLVSPAPAKALSNDDPQVFTIASSDAEGDPYTGAVTIRTPGGTVVTSFTTPPTPSGRESRGTPAPPLPVGDYTWAAKATDAKGAVGPESAPRAFSVIVPRPPGIPTLVAPGSGEALHPEDAQVFTVAADDPNGDLYSATVTVRDQWNTEVDTFRTAPAPSGDYSSGVPTLPLFSGHFTWTATATDAGGASGAPSPARAFTVSSDSGLPPAALPSDVATTRASTSTIGEQAGAAAEDPAVSADGRYVAFASAASNLVPLDTNSRRDVFVRDRVSGVTERVSVSSSGAQAAGPAGFESFAPSISTDGRYVSFLSTANNLVTGDTNGWQDVFVHDRQTKETTRVSLSSSGSQANGSSLDASISGNGRFVAFSSGASNLVGGDGNFSVDVFVRDRTAGTTERVSVSFPNGSGTRVEGNGASERPSISADGRYVVFDSVADNLQPTDVNGVGDAFVHDRSDDMTLRISLNTTYAGADGTSREPNISPDGRWIVYSSSASDIVPGDTNGRSDVFLYDNTWEDTRRVSVNSSGAQANGHSFEPVVSGRRYVAFRSAATNLVAVDRNGSEDVFLRDLDTAATTLVSHDADGHQANGRSLAPSLSEDGMHVAFSSWASNLVPADTNLTTDVFAYNRRMSLDCAAGALSAVGCLSGYGFKASSDRVGLEDFYSYHAFDVGADTAYLNVSNGNLVVQGTDLDVPGQGLNMRLTHTYNSQKDQGEGPLGRGWRIGVADGDSADLLGAVVSAVTSADVGQLLEVVVTEDQFDFFDADGTRHHFIKGGLDGPGWHAPPGVNLTLTDFLVGAERRYRAVRPDGVSYEFRPTGAGGSGYALKHVADRNGNQLTFSYSSGRLSSITDTNSRSVSFVWTGDYLSSASYGGTTVTYTVNTATGRLGSIAVGGRTTSYGYNGEGLRTVTDGRGNTTTFTLSGGMLTQVADRAGKAWGVSYNTGACQPGDSRAAVATCVTDPEGKVEVYTSSAEGNLLSHRDAGDTAPHQRSRLWESNRVVSETDEGGNTTEYAYNANGQVVLQRESGSGDPTLTTKLDYRDVAPGVADLVAAQVGVDSNDVRTWRFGRSETGNLTSVTDPPADPDKPTDVTVTRFTYLSGGRVASVTDPRGKTTSYAGYHASGQPGTVTDPLGKTKTFAYDAFGRVTSVLDRNGQSWSTGYDARGNATSRSSPVGTATYAYDLNDNQTSATPPGGATVTRTFDGRDLLTESSATVGGVLRKSTYGYYDDGQLKEVNEPRTFAGSPTVTQKVTYERYPNNRVSAMVDEAGFRTDLTYTPEGLIRTATEPAGTAGRHVTAYTFNRRGQTTSTMETGHSNPTTNVHNLHGELVSTKTPGGRTTTFAYDRLGRLLRTVDAQGRSSTRTYDPAGNMVTLTQPEGQGGSLTTTYSYTARNEIASESDPADGGHTVEYAYDDEGRQRFRYDKHNGTLERTVEQTWRSDGAMLTRTASGTGLTTHASTFGYDTAGNMTSATATLGGATVSSLSLSYNGAFEPTGWTETLYDTAGIARSRTGSYAYQPDGLLASRTVDGLTTNYTHTADGREATVVPWVGGGFANEYFDNGLLKKTTMPNGAVLDQLFDPADRLVSRIVHKPDPATAQLSAWTGIAYDEDDRRIGETVTQAQVPGTTTEPVKAGNAEYSYDALGRLTSAKHPFEPGTAAYTLDDGGNVVKDADSAYTYDKNRLRRRSTTTSTDMPEYESTVTTLENATYAYDHLGNQTRETATTTTTVAVPDESFTDTKDTIRGFTYDAASHPRSVTNGVGGSVNYVYDALDRLVRRVEHPGGSGPEVVTLFFHDGTSEQLVQETDGAGTVQARYVLDSAGEPLGQQKYGSLSWYVDDPRGNLTQQLDNSRIPTAVYGYDPYGKEKKGLTRSASASWDSRLRFQMAPRDPATGAYNLGPRLLDPAVNRFVGADMYVDAAADMDLALDPLTGNRYLYAGANPAGLIDDGHGWCPAGHRKQAKGSKRHPGCKGGSRHVKKAVGTAGRVGKAAVKTTVKVARTAAVQVGRGARGVYRTAAEHSEVIAQTAGVAAFGACVVVTTGLCSAAAGAALGATVFESGVDNRIFSSGNNWNAFIIDTGVAIAGYQAGQRLGNFTLEMEKGILRRGYQPVVSRGYGIGTRLWGDWLLLSGQQELVGE